VPRLGRADHRAHAARSALAGEPVGETLDQLGEALVQWPLGSREILDVGGARVAGADQREDTRPRLGRGGDQRLERVEAEQRVGGEGVGAEAGNGAPGRRRLADQRLRVGGGGDGDVAALAVGDDQQAGFTSRLADLSQGGPAGRPEPLEAGELRLDRDAGRARPLDQAAAVGRDGCRGQLGGGLAGGQLDRVRGELPRVGVEPEADLAAALLYERREPIREGSRY
jgi:hypothetical protein